MNSYVESKIRDIVDFPKEGIVFAISQPQLKTHARLN